MTIKKLTVNDIVILHLLGYINYKIQSEVPFTVTQQGIADAVDINLSHVPRSVKRLAALKLLTELKAHVQASSDLKGSTTRKRKVYFLTDKGIRLGKKIQAGVESQQILFVDKKSKSNKLRLAELAKKIKPVEHSNILSLYNFVMTEGHGDKFELSKWLEHRKPSDVSTADPYSVKYPRILATIPEADNFFGRDKELKLVKKGFDTNDIKLIFVVGERGIGKTAFVSASLAGYYQHNNILWCECQTENIFQDLLSELSKLLLLANRKSLHNYLTKTDLQDLDNERVVEILRRDLHEVGAVIILDGIVDLSLKNREFTRWLDLINQSLVGLPELKLIFTGRTLQPMIKKFETKFGSKQVQTLELAGLDKKASRKILGLGKTKIGAQEFEAIYHHTQGNPLFLEMIATVKLKPPKGQESYSDEDKALLKYMKVVEKLGG